MDKVRVLIVGRTNIGKTTIAHLVRQALEEHGFQKVTFLDTPDSEGKASIEERVEDVLKRPVSIEVITLNRVPLGDAPIVSRTVSGEFEVVGPLRKKL